MLSSEFSYSYPAEGDVMEGLTCSWPPSQTWMLLSYVGLTTRISFHCNPECVWFTWLQPTSAILYTWTFLFTSGQVCSVLLSLFRWPVPMESTRCGILLSLHNVFFYWIVSVCVAWSGGRAVIQNWSAWLHIGLEDRNFLLPRIPRPALLTINPALPALLHSWTLPNNPWFDSWHLMISEATGFCSEQIQADCQCASRCVS